MPRQRLKRLLRISLRGLLVVVTVLCVLLAFKVREVERQKAAVAWAMEVEGSVTYDDHNTIYWVGNPPKQPSAQGWLYNLIGVDYFFTVTQVELDSDDLVDLAPLASFPHLKSLVVRCAVAKDLSPLADLRGLQYLELDCPEVHDLSPLAELKNLDTLWIQDSVDDNEIEQLKAALPSCRIVLWQSQWE